MVKYLSINNTVERIYFLYNGVFKINDTCFFRSENSIEDLQGNIHFINTREDVYKSLKSHLEWATLMSLYLLF